MTVCFLSAQGMPQILASKMGGEAQVTVLTHVYGLKSA
jgi:hypothetical protein